MSVVIARSGTTATMQEMYKEMGRKRSGTSSFPSSLRGIGTKRSMAELNLTKRVTFEVPLHISEYLSLYSHAEGITKSELLLRIVEDWIHRSREEKPDIVLLRNIADKLQEEWDKNYKGFKGLSFDRFKEAVEYTLRNASIKSVYVETILNELKP